MNPQKVTRASQAVPKPSPSSQPVRANGAPHLTPNATRLHHTGMPKRTVNCQECGARIVNDDSRVCDSCAEGVKVELPLLAPITRTRAMAKGVKWL